ncbi:hypothetical protein ACQR10_21595 [Bradyrhizobium sp. HKCCYLRH2060]|uniref:hypothetical protein n=1 Tax=unclassified Bradyrhizobium TaxID=2631580 RepID=UPI003EBF6A9E
MVKSDAAKAVTKAAPQSATGKTSAKLGKGVIAVAPPSFRRERALLPPPSFKEAGQGEGRERCRGEE